jgi:predicted nucleic acid-binding Zn ribbon protein
MDPAGKLLNSLPSLERLESVDQKLRRSWKSAVGATIANHSQVLQLRDKTLLVTVEDAVWKSQLEQMRFQILDRIRTSSGVSEIKWLNFRVSPPRIRPQVVQAPLFAADEADRIQDPLLRRIYKSSRRKAQA